MFIFAISLCLLLSFLLSGAEGAVMAVSRARVRTAAEKGDRRARGMLALLEDRDSLLGCVTVANHLVNLSVVLLLAWPLVRQKDVWLSTLTFFISLPLFLLLLEVIPKKLFRRFPFRSLRSIAPLLHLVGVARPLFRTFAVARSASEAPGDADGQRREDLRELSAQLVAQQQISSSASRLIGGVLGYRQRTLRALMQPLDRSIALAAELPLATALIIAREQSLPVLPVLGEKGDFIGVLDTTELPPVLPPDRLVRQHMRTLVSLSAETPALQALQRLRKQGRRLAIVTNDRDQPVGLITEDQLLAPLMQ